jgi:excisionase family DNA binding protein
MLGTVDAAAYVGLAVQTLAKMRVSGESPPFYKLGRQVLYDRAELDEWVAARRRRSTSDVGKR